MPLESSLEDMKILALEMGSYYYKGLGTTLDGILSNVELYRLRRRDDLKPPTYKWLKEIEDLYSGIPFDKLNGRQEFYPLFIVKRLLPKLKENLDIAFSDPSKSHELVVVSSVTTIADIGRLYDDTFKELLDKIRLVPEEKDFRVSLVDHKGHTWRF